MELGVEKEAENGRKICKMGEKATRGGVEERKRERTGHVMVDISE